MGVEITWRIRLAAALLYVVVKLIRLVHKIDPAIRAHHQPDGVRILFPEEGQGSYEWLWGKP
jgi:hypothetical protein